jgi:hypothetical protein
MAVAILEPFIVEGCPIRSIPAPAGREIYEAFDRAIAKAASEITRILCCNHFAYGYDRIGWPKAALLELSKVRTGCACDAVSGLVNGCISFGVSETPRAPIGGSVLEDAVLFAIGEVQDRLGLADIECEAVRVDACQAYVAARQCSPLSPFPTMARRKLADGKIRNKNALEAFLNADPKAKIDRGQYGKWLKFGDGGFPSKRGLRSSVVINIETAILRMFPELRPPGV